VSDELLPKSKGGRPAHILCALTGGAGEFGKFIPQGVPAVINLDQIQTRPDP